MNHNPGNEISSDDDDDNLILGIRLPRRRTNWRVRHDGLSQRQHAILRQLECSRSDTKTTYDQFLLLLTIFSTALAIGRRFRMNPFLERNLVKVIQVLTVLLGMAEQRHQSITHQMQKILFIRQGDRESTPLPTSN